MDTGHDVTGPINLGNPEEVTMLRLAKMVSDIAGASEGIEHRPLRQGDPKRRCPAIAQARDVLGWRPTTSLPDGLVRAVDHFRHVGRGA
jgi:UDP-glucuronate decarboxylase